MARKSIEFFATPNDLVSLLRAAAAIQPLKFVLLRIYREPKPMILDNPARLDSHAQYLVTKADVPINVEGVPQRRGGMHYFADGSPQISRSVVLNAGGFLRDGRLTWSRIATAFDEEEPTALMELFFGRVRRDWERIKDDYVGPEAAALLDQGTKLIWATYTPGQRRQPKLDQAYLQR